MNFYLIQENSVGEKSHKYSEVGSAFRQLVSRGEKEKRNRRGLQKGCSWCLAQPYTVYPKFPSSQWKINMFSREYFLTAELCVIWDPKEINELGHPLLGPYLSWWLGCRNRGSAARRDCCSQGRSASHEAGSHAGCRSQPYKGQACFRKPWGSLAIAVCCTRSEARQYQWGFDDRARNPPVPAKAWEPASYGRLLLGYQPYASPCLSEATQEGLLTQNKCDTGRKVQHRSQCSRHIRLHWKPAGSPSVSSVCPAITEGER